MLETAAPLKVLRVGEVTLALDGTEVLADASKHSDSPIAVPRYSPPPPRR